MPSPLYSSFVQRNFILGERRSGNDIEQETFSSVHTLQNYRVIPGRGAPVKRRPGTTLENLYRFDFKMPVRKILALSGGYILLSGTVEDSGLYFLKDGQVSELSFTHYRSTQRTLADNGSLNVAKIVDLNFGAKLDSSKRIDLSPL